MHAHPFKMQAECWWARVGGSTACLAVEFPGPRHRAPPPLPPVQVFDEVAAAEGSAALQEENKEAEEEQVAAE